MRKAIALFASLSACAAFSDLAAIPPINPSDEFSAEVVRVIDGDTLFVLRDGREVEVRLAGVDAPEIGQAYSDLARNGLAHAVLGKVIHVRVLGRDLDTCPLVRVYLGEFDINLELVKAGLAWHYRQRELRDKVFVEAQKQARKARRGIWQRGPRAIPPWEFREALEQAERVESDDHTDQFGYTPPKKSGGG